MTFYHYASHRRQLVFESRPMWFSSTMFDLAESFRLMVLPLRSQKKEKEKYTKKNRSIHIILI